MSGITNHWSETYRIKKGAEYDWTKADAVTLQRLTKKHGDPIVGSAITLFLSERDKWIEEHTGYTVGMFKKRFNMLLLRVLSGKQGTTINAPIGKYSEIGTNRNTDRGDADSFQGKDADHMGKRGQRGLF